MTNRKEQTEVLLDLIHEGVVARATLEIADEERQALGATERARLTRTVRRGEAATGELVELHEPLVRKVFKSQFRSLGHLRDDMYQAGRAALFSAIMDYERGSNARFSTFAYQRIYNAMRGVEAELRHAVSLPVQAATDIRALHGAMATYRQTSGDVKFSSEDQDWYEDDFTAQMLAEVSGIPQDRIEAVLPYLSGYSSVDKPLGTSDEGETVTLLDVLADEDEEEDTVTRLEAERLLALLSDEEAFVVRSIVMYGVGQAEVAESLGISQQAVSKRLKKAIKTLREEVK